MSDPKMRAGVAFEGHSFTDGTVSEEAALERKNRRFFRGRANPADPA